MTAFEMTNHTYESVRGGARFINWNAQPYAFKRYPAFYMRIPYSACGDIAPLFEAAYRVSETRTSGGATYTLRTNPSAGALYPNEVYVQSRGVAGLEDGIYHLEADTEVLTFIAPIAHEGIEFFCAEQTRFQGLIFLVSGAYFRSSWKYGDRSIRYCLLDAGHVLGCIEAAVAVVGKSISFEGVTHRKGLGEFMGFENKEFPLWFAKIGVHTATDVKKPSSILPFVMAYDYFERNEFVEHYLEQELRENADLTPFSYEIDAVKLRDVIDKRRSIRAFFGRPITKAEFTTIKQVMRAMAHIQLYFVVNRVDGVACGIYRGDDVVREGDFSANAGYLCLEQALGSMSGVTVFITSHSPVTQTALIEAGLTAHRIYLMATQLGIGVSGIGAFYDEQARQFLGTQEHIVYALAFGR